jgi:hypothetical protein
MLSPVAKKDFRSALRRAAVRATYAPSVHNTQPWTIRLGPDRLRVYLDPSRQLPVLDPTGRQMTISVGCAVMNARVALAAEGIDVQVERFPSRQEPDLAATLTVTGRPVEMSQDRLASLDHVLERRQTNRRQFAHDNVPPELLQAVEQAAAAEGALVHVVRDAAQRLVVATLSQHADDIENLNPAYRAELRAWTTDDPLRGDGVTHLAVPHVDGRSGDEIPIRDFDTRGTGGLPSQTRSSRDQCLVIVATDGDTRCDWLRAGEALERVLLEITRHGFVASPLTQVTEVPSARAQLRRELGLPSFPHVLLRVGRAAATPGSRRRRLVEVLVDDE